MRRGNKRIIILLILLSLSVLAEIGTLETQWTDFSPQPVEVMDNEEVTDIADPTQNWSYPIQNWIPQETLQSEQFKAKLDKEKYRIYFEDKSLVLMVLGGLEYWKMNCGKLSNIGEYFMKLAIKKHDIDIDEMNMDISFQTGLFAATLYNDCDIFLEQTKSIGLGMMFKKTPNIVQEIILDTVPEANI
jgi:hypothetical protein